MSVTRRASRWAGARVSRRLARSMPWIGAAVALAMLATTVRRKGWVGGAADTALNALPFLGALKNTAETVRGRDFIPDRT
ncbi:MAG TPA: hypothetical protein VK886_04545 [Vicinamibacterales bacterium]|nr:hypothetical protein [Vicinamibacterales bacterium]